MSWDRPGRCSPKGKLLAIVWSCAENSLDVQRRNCLHWLLCSSMRPTPSFQYNNVLRYAACIGSEQGGPHLRCEACVRADCYPLLLCSSQQSEHGKQMSVSRLLPQPPLLQSWWQQPGTEPCFCPVKQRIARSLQMQSSFQVLPVHMKAFGVYLLHEQRLQLDIVTHSPPGGGSPLKVQ